MTYRIWATAACMVMAGAFAARAEEAPPPWPIEADIPRPAPVALGLAGQSLDITRYLMVQGAREAHISPDGESLAYISSISGAPQLWTVDAAGGWPTQLTFGSGIDGATWLPDGSAVLYGADTAGDEKLGFYRLTPDGGHESALLAKMDAYRQLGEISDDGRLAYASTQRNGRDFDIRLTEVDAGARDRQVYQGSFGFFPLEWRPKTSQVLVAEQRGEDASDLHILDVDTGELATIFKPKVAASHDAATWLSDGSGFYLLTNEDREFQNLAFYDMKTRKLSFVAGQDHDVTGLALSFDDRFLVSVTDVEGFSRLDVLDRTTGAKVVPPVLPRGTYQVEFARHAAVLAIRVIGPRAVGDVYVWNPATGALTHPIRTSWAGLDAKAMVEPEPVTFKARDGLTIHGLFYAPKPAAGGGKPPLLIKVHGGPSSQALPAYSPEVQYFVARGVAVMDLNYRGSTGFGKSYARANDKRLRVNELGDVESAVAFLRRSGRVDPDRAAIMGASYGGYLTNAAVGAYPDLFKAGVSIVGVSDWVKALEGAAPALKASDREEYGDVTDPSDRAFMATLSPINNVARIKTPLLVEHGANDVRDPVTESDRLVEGVRRNGTEVVYLRFPDEGHQTAKLANKVHAWTRIADFLEEKFGMAVK